MTNFLNCKNTKKHFLYQNWITNELWQKNSIWIETIYNIIEATIGEKPKDYNKEYLMRKVSI